MAARGRAPARRRTPRPYRRRPGPERRFYPPGLRAYTTSPRRGPRRRAAPRRQPAPSRPAPAPRSPRWTAATVLVRSSALGGSQRGVHRCLEVLVQLAGRGGEEGERLGVDGTGEAGGGVHPEMGVEQPRPGSATGSPAGGLILAVDEQPIAPREGGPDIQRARRVGVRGGDVGRERQRADLV